MLQLAELPVLARAAWARRQSRRVRGERELLAAIGSPLLAARPSSSEALDALCRQLLEHWFGRGREPADRATAQGYRYCLVAENLAELNPRMPRIGGLPELGDNRIHASRKLSTELVDVLGSAVVKVGG